MMENKSSTICTSLIYVVKKGDFRMFLLELGNNSVKALEKIMEQDAAGLAVDLMSIASLPVLLQVTRILHYLRAITHIFQHGVFKCLQVHVTSYQNASL